MILFIFAIFILPFSLLVGNAQAQQFVNLRGNIEASYSQTLVDTNTSQSRSPSFLHRYNFGTFGSLGDPKAGSYDADISYQEDIGKTNGVRNRDQDTLDYRLNLNLLPRKTPLTFFAQRITRDNEIDPNPSRNRLDIYSLTWDLPLQRIPHLRFNLFQSDSKTTPSTVGTVQTRTAGVDASHQFEATSLFTRYQYTEQKSGLSPTTRGHIVNMNSETRINPSTVLNLHGNYSNRAASLGVINPQLSSFQQRSAGAVLTHQPSLALNNRVAYDYFKDPFERHIFQTNTNYRATEKVDLFGSYRYFRFSLDTALTDSHFATFGTNYRPLLGLSTGVNFSNTFTNSNAATDTTVLSQSFNYFMNYFKALERIILNTGFNGNYSRTIIDPGPLSTDLINGITLGINNANPRYVSLGASYGFTNIFRKQSDTEDNSLNQHSFNLTAQSSYLRNLLLRGDFLSMNSSANYLLYDVESGGMDSSIRTDETITYDTLRGIILSTGHNYERIQASVTERNIVFGQIQWVTFLIRNLYLIATARESYQLHTRIDGITIFEGRSNLIYQLGKISFNLDYTYIRQDQGTSDFATQSFFVRASRPLF